MPVKGSVLSVFEYHLVVPVISTRDDNHGHEDDRYESWMLGRMELHNCNLKSESPSLIRVGLAMYMH